MRKSGLHKQISSIFEGAPAPEKTVDTSRSVMRRMAEDDISVQPAPVLAPQGQTSQPACRVARPKPAPKAQITEAPARLKKTTRSAGRKNTAENASAKGRQKLMTVLVGVLSLVFVAVMFVSFGGLGQTQIAPAQPSASASAAPAKTESRFNPESWIFPEPLPAQMRNPLVIPKPTPVVASGQDEVAQSVELIVRGIVYSDTKPSAIIDDKVVMEGHTINGVKVVRVTRSEVEFEKDGKHWTQGVQ